MNDGLFSEDFEEYVDLNDEYLLLLSKMVDAIAELKAVIVALRQEVNSLNPAKPYENDLHSDINPCFCDSLIVQKFPEIFSKLL